MNPGDLIVLKHGGAWVMSGVGELPNHSSHPGITRIAQEGELAFVISTHTFDDVTPGASRVCHDNHDKIWTKTLILVLGVGGNIGWVHRGNWIAMT